MFIKIFIYFNVCKKYSDKKASNQPANRKSLKILFREIKMTKSVHRKMWKHSDPKNGKKVGKTDEDVFCCFKLSRVSVLLIEEFVSPQVSPQSNEPMSDRFLTAHHTAEEEEEEEN